MNETLKAALSPLGITLYHAYAVQNAALPYMVYTEYAEAYRKADNRIDEVITSIQLDYYTKTPHDANKNVIRAALDGAGISFTYRMRHEDDEKVYHHIFDCEVI